MVRFLSVSLLLSLVACISAVGFADGQDVDPPTVTASVDGVVGEGGWYTSSVEISVSASDSGSGLATVEYRVLGAFNWTEYIGPAEFDSDGGWVVEARAYDMEGNMGEDAVQVRVDQTAPVTSSFAEGSVVNLTAVDETSGVSATWYSVDGGDWTLYEGPFEIVGEGNHTLEYWSVDAAGNEEEAETRQVEVIRTESTFSWDWWMVILILALLMIISAGAIFGMRKKATESESRAIIKDIGTAMSQLMDDNPARPPSDQPPAEDQPPKPK